jgi:hypothetical protein
MKDTKKLVGICMIFFVSTIVISCSKSESGSPSPVTAKLKKVHTGPAGQGTDEEFFYNSENLVVKRTLTESNSAHTRSVVSDYYYNGSDPKPVKDSTITTMQITSPPSITSYATISHYTYDSQNRLVKIESYVGGQLMFEKDLTYPAGQIVEDYYNNNTAGTPYTFHIETHDINSLGQVIQTVNDITGAVQYSLKRTFKYDDKPNPYYDLNTFKYLNQGTDSSYDFLGSFSPNNITTDSTFSTNLGGGPFRLTSEVTTTYTYNSSGYPVSAIKNQTDYNPVGTPYPTFTYNVTYEYY